jgi:hypothetical protein
MDKNEVRPTTAQLDFANEVIEPWRELNRLLGLQIAVQPTQSSMTQKAKALAISIKHQVDLFSLEVIEDVPALQRQLDEESLSARIVSDFADSGKHRKLRRPSRQATAFVQAVFEVSSENRFRFLRNKIVIEHASLGSHDFMSIATDAILYWIQKRQLQIVWNDALVEGPPVFTEEASLRYDPAYCIRMDQTRLQFVRRVGGDRLEPFDPDRVIFAIY